MIGSSREARHAGMYAAHAHTTISTPAAVAYADGIGWRDPIEQTAERAGGEEGEWQADRPSQQDQQECFPHDEPLDGATIGAEGDADSQFRGPALDGVRDGPEEAKARQAKCGSAKRHGQPAEKSLNADRCGRSACQVSRSRQPQDAAPSRAESGVPHQPMQLDCPTSAPQCFSGTAGFVPLAYTTCDGASLHVVVASVRDDANDLDAISREVAAVAPPLPIGSRR